MADINEIRAKFIINVIATNKDLDLNDRANTIRDEILNGTRQQVLKWFGVIIDINHATLYELGKTVHLGRPGGWGFLASDDKFLSSLRGQHLGHCYGVTIGTGNLRINALSAKQVDILRRYLSGRFYTLQMALLHPAAPTDGSSSAPVVVTKPAPQPAPARSQSLDPVPF